MTGYTDYSDVSVQTDGEQVQWKDHGEIRHLNPDQAMEFAEMLACAALKAKATNKSD